ncbi:MAG: aminotransferase class V-fold PLP-dependent enzyme [Acidobacteria bacterium]|nr:aminotransferase class V-fold PLP-dependent enzyme [Acidobacteriota bacterium]
MGPISLEEYRRHFSVAPGYLDFARYGPPSDAVTASSASSLSMVSRGFAEIDALKDHEVACLSIVARMTGRPSGESVTFASSTSAAITLVAMALAGGAQAEVLVSPREFPANVYPWVRAQSFGGPRVVWLDTPEGKVTPDVVARSLTSSTVALVVSGVDFSTGYRADLGGLRDVLGNRLLLVDAIQGFGVCDVDWSVADAVMAGGQKWLRASWGTGFISLSSKGEARLGEGLAGWTSVKNPTRYDREVHDTLTSAQRFSLTNCDLIAASRLHAALNLLDDATVPVIEDAVLSIVRSLREVIFRHGGEVIVELSDDELSGIVSFRLPKFSPTQIHEHLLGAGLLVTKHDTYVRASPHATTTLDVVDQFDAALTNLERRRPLRPATGT